MGLLKIMKLIEAPSNESSGSFPCTKSDKRNVSSSLSRKNGGLLQLDGLINPSSACVEHSNLLILER